MLNSRQWAGVSSVPDFFAFLRMGEPTARDDAKAEGNNCPGDERQEKEFVLQATKPEYKRQRSTSDLADTDITSSASSLRQVGSGRTVGFGGGSGQGHEMLDEELEGLKLRGGEDDSKMKKVLVFGVHAVNLSPGGDDTSRAIVVDDSDGDLPDMDSNQCINGHQGHNQAGLVTVPVNLSEQPGPCAPIREGTKALQSQNSLSPTDSKTIHEEQKQRTVVETDSKERVRSCEASLPVDTAGKRGAEGSTVTTGEAGLGEDRVGATTVTSIESLAGGEVVERRAQQAFAGENCDHDNSSAAIRGGGSGAKGGSSTESGGEGAERNEVNLLSFNEDSLFSRAESEKEEARSSRSESGKDAKVTSNAGPAGSHDGEDSDKWAECENSGCGKWRRLPPGMEVGEGAQFRCNMLPFLTCEKMRAEDSLSDDEEDMPEFKLVCKECHAKKRAKISFNKCRRHLKHEGPDWKDLESDPTPVRNDRENCQLKGVPEPGASDDSGERRGAEDRLRPEASHPEVPSCSTHLQPEAQARAPLAGLADMGSSSADRTPSRVGGNAGPPRAPQRAGRWPTGNPLGAVAGVNDTYNAYQSEYRGRNVTRAEWEQAKEQLWLDFKEESARRGDKASIPRPAPMVVAEQNPALISQARKDKPVSSPPTVSKKNALMREDDAPAWGDADARGKRKRDAGEQEDASEEQARGRIRGPRKEKGHERPDRENGLGGEQTDGDLDSDGPLPGATHSRASGESLSSKEVQTKGDTSSFKMCCTECNEKKKAGRDWFGRTGRCRLRLGHTAPDWVDADAQADRVADGKGVRGAGDSDSEQTNGGRDGPTTTQVKPPLAGSNQAPGADGVAVQPKFASICWDCCKFGKFASSKNTITRCRKEKEHRGADWTDLRVGGAGSKNKSKLRLASNCPGPTTSHAGAVSVASSEASDHCEGRVQISGDTGKRRRTEKGPQAARVVAATAAAPIAKAVPRAPPSHGLGGGESSKQVQVMGKTPESGDFLMSCLACHKKKIAKTRCRGGTGALPGHTEPDWKDVKNLEKQNVDPEDRTERQGPQGATLPVAVEDGGPAGPGGKKGRVLGEWTTTEVCEMLEAMGPKFAKAHEVCQNEDVSGEVLQSFFQDRDNVARNPLYMPDQLGLNEIQVRKLRLKILNLVGARV